jgi:PAS domain S-box-containing protein
VTDKDNHAEQPFPESEPTGSMQTRQALRLQAEAIARQKTALTQNEIAAMTPEGIQQLLHELLVHRIELEMQNEELRRTQTVLHASRTRYFDLYDLAPVGYLTISDNGLILEANLTAATLLGVPRGTLIRQPLSRFIFKEDQDVSYLHRKQLDICTPLMCELRLVKPDGTVFWAHLVTTDTKLIDDGAASLLVLSDITEHKQLETALRESEVRFRRLLRDVPSVAVQGYRPDGTTQYWNHASEQLYGYAAEEAVGRNLLDLIIPPEMRRAFKQGMQQMAMTGRPIPASELSLMRKDGSRVNVFSSHTIVQLPGQLPELFCIDVDLTERKQMEEIMAARLRLLRATNTHSLTQLLQATLDEAEVLTGSHIGFYHFMEHDQTTLTLQAWSTNTVEGMCKAAGAGQHYPVSHAGVWVDCIHARKPVIHNDYAALPHRKGLPQGHVPLTRELVVPVMRQDAIVAVLGVGNKPTNYTERDVAALTSLADLAWEIVEHKRAEEALRQSEHLRHQAQETANAQLKEQAESLTSIYNALDSIGLIVCDLEKSDARISIFSVGAEKLFGYQQTEAIGESIALIYPPEFIGIIPLRVEKFRQGKPMHSFNMTLVRKSGEHFPAVISVHPFDAYDGGFRKVVGIFRDITELIKTQEQLKAANITLEQRVEQRTLELQETQKQYLHAEKLSAIGKLSASIAHEFNNPLQGILSILKGLKKRAILEPEDKELLDAAISESDRIKDLIRSLQEFNRPSSGKKVPMDVHKSLNAILLLHKSDFKNRQIYVELKYTEPLPQIFAVPDQIKQVFLNLLTNAGDACQESGGVITISTWKVDDKVAVTIHDTGIGIKPEEMAFIFQPFYTTKPEVKGTGLGLSVSYGIIKQHQGEIRVESCPGEGATFTVLLPIMGAYDATPDTSN